MRLKGIALPVNSVIIIALAVMVLLMLAGFFAGGFGQTSSTNVASAWNKGCRTLDSAYNCDASQVDEIDTGKDITGDEVTDDLLAACRTKFGTTPTDKTITEKFCRNKCCHTVISTDLECNEDIDCTSAIGGGGWTCPSSGGNCTEP